MNELKVGDIVIVAANWKQKQHVKAQIVAFWSPSETCPFLDVRSIEDGLSHTVRRDDVVSKEII